MNKPKPCPKCDGQGVVSLYGEHTIVVTDCDVCGGDGHICDGEDESDAEV